MNIKILIDLYFTFMKIGGFTIGGGYAMIPIIQHEVTDNKKWISETEITDYITLAQSTPGVVGINMATAVGYKVKGLLGAFAATLGMITPSFIIIIIIAMLFDEFQKQTLVQTAFSGVRAAVVALIFIALVRLTKTSVKDKLQILIMVATSVGVLLFKVQPQYMLLASALFAVIFKHKKKEVE